MLFPRTVSKVAPSLQFNFSPPPPPSPANNRLILGRQKTQPWRRKCAKNANAKSFSWETAQMSNDPVTVTSEFSGKFLILAVFLQREITLPIWFSTVRVTSLRTRVIA